MSRAIVISIKKITFQSLCFPGWQAFAGISLASSGLLASPQKPAKVCHQVKHGHVENMYST